MKFLIDADKIDILGSPKQYYKCLKMMIRTAKNRVNMSSLYLGTGEYEKELVNELKLLKSRRREVECSMIFDKGRSERKEQKSNMSSIDLLKPLTHYHNTNIYLYHNPLINKAVKYLPSVMKEMIGVFHTKIVISDDNILLTGANYSHSYFTNRTDRYYLLRNCKDIADYLSSYLHTISLLSSELKGDGKSYSPNRETNTISTKLLSSYAFKYKHIPIDNLPNDKVLFFLSNQLKHQGICNEESNFKELFKQSTSLNKIIIHSGYLNLSPLIINQLTKINKNDIYTSSPQANSFYKGGHIKSLIPYMYRVYERDLLSRKIKGVRLFEYIKPEWTFHGKGLWLFDKNNLPIITAIGSSNYSKLFPINYSNIDERSFQRDLETQFYFMSTSPKFIMKLQEEVNKNQKDFKEITMEKIDSDRDIVLNHKHYFLGKICKGLL